MGLKFTGRDRPLDAGRRSASAPDSWARCSYGAAVAAPGQAVVDHGPTQPLRSETVSEERFGRLQEKRGSLPFIVTSHDGDASLPEYLRTRAEALETALVPSLPT